MSGIYLGNSTVADPLGQTMVTAENVETMLIVDCIPTEYPPTHPEGASDFFKDRRPELFGQLTSMYHRRQDGNLWSYPADPNHDDDLKENYHCSTVYEERGRMKLVQSKQVGDRKKFIA